MFRLVAVLLLTGFSLWADTFGDWEYWNYSQWDPINGNVEMVSINRYIGTNSNVIIPSTINGRPVVNIGYNAFFENDKPTSIYIPETIKTIGYWRPFGNCTNLLSINVATNNLNFSSLNGVLYNKDQTVLVACPAGLSGSFSVPNGVTTLDDNAFYGCTKLTNITLPLSLSGIAGTAFAGCSSLTQLDIPESVVSMGDTFWYCTSLTNINVASNNQYYSSSNGALYNKNKSTIISVPNGIGGSFEILSSVNKIGIRSFLGCSLLSNIVVPSGVTVIEEGAFSDCTNLKTLQIGNSLTNIGDWTFARCYSLTNVSPLTSLRTLGKGAFVDCTNLRIVTLTGSTVSRIEEATFARCSALATISLPSSVTYLGKQSFMDCASLQSISLAGSSISQIDEATFARCSSLSSVSLPNGLTRIERQSFDGCSSLSTINIPNTVQVIHDAAFRDCANLTNITIPVLLTYLGEQSFARCVNLSGTLTLPDSLSGELRQDTFNDCRSINNLVFGSNITHIKRNSLFNCIGLTNLTMPISLRVVEEQAFHNCTNLTTITFPKSLEYLSVNAFQNCGSLTSLVYGGNRPNLTESWWGSPNFNIPATNYVLSSATGWSSTFGGRPVSQITASQILNSPNSFSLYTQEQINSYRNQGRGDVTNDPNYYNLYTANQFNENRVSGQQDVISSPSTYNLYRTNEIHNMRMGGMVLSRSNNQLNLNYEIQQSPDLSNWSSYLNQTVTITNAPTNKMFLRILPKQ